MKFQDDISNMNTHTRTSRNQYVPHFFKVGGITIMGRSPKCYIPSFVEIGPPVLEKKIFKGFYHIWAWQPSWSCDLDHLYKLSFPLPNEVPHKIWLGLVKRFSQRRRRLKTVDNDNNDDDGRRSMGIL